MRAAFIYRSFLDLSRRVSLSFSAALYLCAIYLPPRSGTSVGLGHIILREEPLSILRGRARQHSGFQADSRYYSRTEGRRERTEGGHASLFASRVMPQESINKFFALRKPRYSAGTSSCGGIRYVRVHLMRHRGRDEREYGIIRGMSGTHTAQRERERERERESNIWKKDERCDNTRAH